MIDPRKIAHARQLARSHEPGYGPSLPINAAFLTDLLADIAEHINAHEQSIDDITFPLGSAPQPTHHETDSLGAVLRKQLP